MLLLTHAQPGVFSCQFGCQFCQKPVDIQTAVVIGPFNDAGIDVVLAATSLAFTIVDPECLAKAGAQHMKQIYRSSYAERPLRDFIPTFIAQLQTAITVTPEQ